jgi:hypothetical protein
MCESQVIYGRRDVPLSSPHWFHGTRELRGLRPGDPEQDLVTAVRIHQRLTVDNYLQLLELAPEIPWMPVLQGATPASYIECADQYAAAGVDLGAEPIVNLGSVCRRQATNEIGAIVSTFADRGWLLHGLGVKSAGITKYGHLLASADSLAWSTGARRAPRPAGCTHRAERCQNCPRYALRWRAPVSAPCRAGVSSPYWEAAPQHRQRILFAFTKKGLPLPDLRIRPACWCPECGPVQGVQIWGKRFDNPRARRGPTRGPVRRDDAGWQPRSHQSAIGFSRGEGSSGQFVQ